MAKSKIIATALPFTFMDEIGDLLSEGLDLSLYPTQLSTFPESLLLTDLLRRLTDSGGISRGDFQGSKFNFRVLKEGGIDRVVVQVRDPRDILLSWFAYLEPIHEEKGYQNELFDTLESIPPEHYFLLTREEIVTWLIEHYLRPLVRWIDSWVQVSDNPDNGLEVLFTRFENFCSDPENYVSEITQFYEVGADFYPNTMKKLVQYGKDLKEAEKDRSKFYDFTIEQRDTMLQLIPERYFKRFGWLP